MSSTASESKPKVGLTRADFTIDRILTSPYSVQSVLIFGWPGSGGEYLAEKLAKSWLCKTPFDGHACGNCPVCRAYENGRAVDLLRIKPAGAGRMVKQIAIYRSPTDQDDPEFPGPPLIDFMRTSPLIAKSKVAVIEGADRLTQSASHTMLKLLEELPAYGKVILWCHNIADILPTIRSRCLVVACDTASLDELAQAYGGLSDVERIFARTPGDVLRIRAHSGPYEDLHRLLTRLPQMGKGSALRLSEDLRSLATKLPAQDDSARGHQIVLLEEMSKWISARHRDQNDLIQQTVDSARMINGNVNAGLVMDALCAKLLIQLGRRK